MPDASQYGSPAQQRADSLDTQKLQAQYSPAQWRMIDSVGNGQLAKDANGNWYNPQTPTGFDGFMDKAVPMATGALASLAFGPEAYGLISGAGNALVNGGNPLTGALKGYATGSLGSLLAPVGNAVSGAVEGGTLGSVLGGAAQQGLAGGLGAAITGGDIGKAALQGAVSGGVGGGMKGWENSSGALDALGQPMINALNSGVGGAVSSALHGGNATNGAIMGTGSSLLGYGANQVGNAIGDGIGGLMASNTNPGGVSDSAPASASPYGKPLDFSSSMPTAADLQNPNISLDGMTPNFSFSSGNNMSTPDPFSFDSYANSGPSYDPSVGPTLSQSTDPSVSGGGSYGSYSVDPLPNTPMDFSSSMPTQTDLSGLNLGNLGLGSISDQTSSAVNGGAASSSSPSTQSWINKLMGQLGVGSGAGQNGTKSLSALQQIAALAGLTGVVGSALGGNKSNQTPNYQSIPGSAAASYGSGSGSGGSGFNWTNYGYQPRVQNPAMKDPNIDWTHYGEQSQANKPGGGVFFTPAPGAPVNAGFGPSQQQNPQPVNHAHGGSVRQHYAFGGPVSPLERVAAMAPQVASQNHVNNMSQPQPFMGPMGGQEQAGNDNDGDDSPRPSPDMGIPFGDNLRGPRQPPQLGGTGNMMPGQMQNRGMDRGDRFNGDAFTGHPMFNGLGRQPMMGGQQLHGAMGLNPGAMPMQQQPPNQSSQMLNLGWGGSPFAPPGYKAPPPVNPPPSGGMQGALSGIHPTNGLSPQQGQPSTGNGTPQMITDPGSEVYMGQQQPYTGSIGAPQMLADGGSTSSNAGYTGLPADGGNSYWQAVKDRIGEIIGTHHVGTGAADQAAQKLYGRGKQIDDAVSASDHAKGGEITSPLQYFSGHGYVTGPGDGQSDDIPAKLSNGEYVISADVVSALGNGSNEVGANKLDGMMQNVRKSVSKNHAKGELQPKAKDPHSYIGKGSR